MDGGHEYRKQGKAILDLLKTAIKAIGFIQKASIG